jgi:hypothetical protein
LTAGHTQTSSQDTASLATESVERSQVVAVGTPLPTASLPVGAHQGPVMVSVNPNENKMITLQFHPFTRLGLI